MNKTKAVSLLLSVALLLSIVIPGTLALQAFATGTQDDSGMVIDKTAQKNGDGSYTITLEAYATGSKITTETKTDVPTDIVLVLDQSGSMKNSMNTYAFRAYSNKDNGDYYNLRHNGASKPNLYHQLADGSYASVSVKLDRGESSFTYAKCPETWKNNVFSLIDDPDDYWKHSNSLYIKIEDTDGNYQYQKVELTRKEDTSTGWLPIPTYTYEYKFPNGTTVTSSGGNSVPEFGNNGPLYYRTEVPGEGTYTYTYTDQDGVTQTIGTSTGETTQPEFTLYERYESGSKTRLAALQTAVSGFADSVKTKAAGQDGQIGTADDVNHRVAVVGFASQHDSDNAWRNTEVFIGAEQYNYNSNASSHYTDALQNMNTTAGYNNVIASNNALAADGATYPNYGLEMAKGILDANPVQQGEKRNRVVTLFTDGAPGRTGYDSDVASAAVTQASTLKNAGVTVYSVGIFEGADATSAGIADGAGNRRENQFMQNVSSNNGTPRNPSYYLSASDADTLNSIFQQISGQIEEGGSSTTLNEATVIKDIIAPAFTLPASTPASDITLETYACTGKDGDTYIWAKNYDAMGATAVIGSTNTADATTTNNQVSVTGFDFAANYVGTVTDNGSVSYRGNKLVIKFTVTPRPGFFGGNGVATNTSAGVYENAQAETPVLTFDRPTVDVPLAKPEVTVPDANVYLGAYYSQTVPEDAVKMGATVKIGGYNIDFSKANDPDKPYGLEPWQVEYVNISISAAATNGGSFENIQEDISYTVTVTVSPKTPGTSGDQSTTDTGTGAIHVFKPQLTFKDSDVWYGGAAPESYSGNLAEETWVNSDGTKKHDDEGVTMLNTKPTLTLNYASKEGAIADNKINTKQDIPVKVDVTMLVGQAQTQTNVNVHTTFKHTDCNPACSWNETTLNGDPAFLLHVKTCTLTINKTGGAAGESYVFDVLKDGTKYSEVTIVGNRSENIYELPVGTYTIEEDTGWSWRYNAENDGRASLTADSPNGSITCTNTKTQNYWLNGFSQVIRNIFGTANN